MARKPQLTQAAKSLANDEDRKAQARFTHNKGRYKRLLEAKKEADAAIRNFGKDMKSELGDYGLDMIKLSIKMEKSEGVAETRQRLLESVRILRWEGIAVGFQDDLFPDKDTRSLDELAYEAGRRAGLNGDAMTAPTEYGAGEVYQQWCKGWHDGQTEIFDIKKGPAQPEPDEDDDEVDPRDEAPRDPNVVFGKFNGNDADNGDQAEGDNAGDDEVDEPAVDETQPNPATDTTH